MAKGKKVLRDFKRNREKILVPISKKNPSGESMRYAPVWDKIREARREEEPLPQGPWTRPLKHADWEAVITLSLQSLTKDTKDLQIAAWLVEALYYVAGLKGLGHGLAVYAELMTQFWDTVYPYASEDPEYRVAPTLWLNRQLTKGLRFLEVTAANASETAPFTYWQYELVKASAKSGPTKDANAQKAARLAEAIADTPQAFYDDMLQDAHALKGQIRRVEDIIITHYREFPAVLKNLRDKLEKMIVSFEAMRQDAKKDEEMTKETTPPQETGGEPIAPQGAVTQKGGQANMTAMPAKAIASREAAYAQLAVIAKFLKGVEPHSPTPYLIDRAVKWGNLSLSEVIQDMTANGTSIEQSLQILGINTRRAS